MSHSTETVTDVSLTNEEVSKLVALLKHPDIQKAISEIQKQDSKK